MFHLQRLYVVASSRSLVFLSSLLYPNLRLYPELTTGIYNLSTPFYKINPLESTDTTPSPRLANEFYEFLATPKLVLLLVALA